jgi:hypothetical protein
MRVLAAQFEQLSQPYLKEVAANFGVRPRGTVRCKRPSVTGFDREIQRSHKRGDGRVG